MAVLPNRIMRDMLSRFFVFVALFIASAAGSHAQAQKSDGQLEKQAEVAFVNKTGLNLRVKVMSVSASRLCAAVDVLPYDAIRVRIAHSGRYFAKARAMMGELPVCIRTGGRSAAVRVMRRPRLLFPRLPP